MVTKIATAKLLGKRAHEVALLSNGWVTSLTENQGCLSFYSPEETLEHFIKYYRRHKYTVTKY